MTTKATRFRPYWLALLVSCADLEEIELGVCGNGVLDRGEDCDSEARCFDADEPNACRYQCKFDDEDPGCPAGFMCGANGVCGRPSDEFANPVELPRGGDAVTIVDLDGDRIEDLAISSDEERLLEVTFFAADLSVEAEARAPIDDARLVAGFVDADDRRDLLVASDAALLSLSSGTDRALVGETFPVISFKGSSARVIAAPARAAGYDPSLPDLLQPDAAIEAVLLDSTLFIRDPYGQGSAATPSVSSVLPPIDFDQITGTLTTSLVPRPPGAPCDELAVARADQPAIVVMPFCDEAGEPVVDDVSACGDDCVFPVDLLDPPQGLFAMQLDLDPEMELVVPLGESDDPTNEIVIVDRVGPYSYLRRDTADGEAWLSALEAVPGAADAKVLLVADIDEDGAPDFVRTDGVFLSNTDVLFDGLTPSYFRAAAPTDPWVEAALGDFDGNGLRDVVASTGLAGADVDLLSNVGLSYFNPKKLPAVGRTRSLIVGDFDGDGSDDLVTRERTVTDDGEVLPLCSDTDDLTLRFGGAQPLGTRTIVGRLAGVEHLAAGRLPRLDKRDSIWDFGVATTCLETEDARAPTTRIAVFFGATNRRVAAPYLLRDVFEKPEQDALVPYVPRDFAVSGRSPITVAVGDRIEAYEPEGVVLHDVIVFVLATTDLTFGSEHLVPLTAEPDASATRVAMGDLDGDGDESVIVVSPTAIHVIDEWSSFVGRTEELEAGQLEAIRSIEHDVPDATIEAVMAADLDADGVDEVLVGGSSNGASFLVVLTELADDAPGMTMVEGLAGTGVAAIDVLSRVEGEGYDVVVALRGTGAAAFSWNGSDLVETAFRPEMSDIESVAVGDVNGDQFDDVVMVARDRTLVLAQELSALGDDFEGEGATE